VKYVSPRPSTAQNYKAREKLMLMSKRSPCDDYSEKLQAWSVLKKISQLVTGCLCDAKLDAEGQYPRDICRSRKHLKGKNILYNH
jgi:hypothetical protein